MDQKNLRTRLKRLFSTDVVVRNVGGKRLKIIDSDGVQQSIDRNSYKDRWSKIRCSGYNTYGRDLSFTYQTTKLELYREYEIMDTDPIITSILDIYADESLTPSEFGNVLTIKSDNEQIKKVLENLFYDILNVEFTLWSWTRSLCKYGDFYLKLNISSEYGIFGVTPLSAYEISRIEGSDPANVDYVKFQHDGGGAGTEYENYEIAHFRLLNDANFAPYGRSILEGGRRAWKQLCLLEDAMLLNRIMRAPEKRVFKIDVGNIPPSEIESHLQKIVTQMKKTPYVDERTGEYNLRFNLNNMIEDIYIPVRGNESGTQIDTLPGMDFTGIDDVEYVKNKMLAAFKVPKPFIGYDEGIGGKSVLAGEDLRFARTITRTQRTIVSELKKIAVIHLFCQGYQDASLADFELELSSPSTIYEQEKLSLWKDKVDLANDMSDAKMFSKEWIYKNVFNVAKDEAKQLVNGVIDDAKEAWRFSQIEEQGNDPYKSRQSIGANGEISDTGGDVGDLGGGSSGGDSGDLSSLDLGGGSSGDAQASDSDIIDQLTEEFGDAPVSQSRDTAIGETLEKMPTCMDPDYVRPERDRVGEKDASDYPFGEDPIGKSGNRPSETRSDPIRHAFRGGSPLALTEIKRELRKKFVSKKVISDENA